MNSKMKNITLTLIVFFVFTLSGFSQSAGTYKLPPMPQREEQHLGFIADPSVFEEVKMDFPMAPGEMAPTWESINAGYERMPDWWRDAKFGIFIHWGPQASGMSGDWYARNIYREETDAYKNHLVNFGHPSEVGYKDVLHQWNPTDWNPEKLVKAYYDAGFRYALIVGVHHDNYDLWNSTYQPWNSVNVGPKKDFLAGWKKELQKKGMRFGVSFHHEYTWWWWQRAFGADKTGPKVGVPYDAAKLTLADGKGKWWEGLDPQRLYGKPMAYENLTFDGKPYILEDIAFGRKGIFGNDLAYAKWHATQWAMRIEDVIDNYDPDYFDSNGPLRGYKRDLYEGGIREPMIVRWPGKVQPGTSSDHISAFWDVMPTIAGITGAKFPADIDGISFLPTLMAQKDQKQHEYMYWEFHEQGGRQALRKENWKLVRYQVFDVSKTTTELYDLATDLGETNNVASKYPGIVEELSKLMNKARVPSEVFKFEAQTAKRKSTE
jgi:hypothetical protein